MIGNKNCSEMCPVLFSQSLTGSPKNSDAITVFRTACQRPGIFFVLKTRPRLFFGSYEIETETLSLGLVKSRLRWRHYYKVSRNQTFPVL